MAKQLHPSEPLLRVLVAEGRGMSFGFAHRMPCKEHQHDKHVTDTHIYPYTT